jgi:chloride channel protein, CIC family
LGDAYGGGTSHSLAPAMRRTSSNRAGVDPGHLISAPDADHRVVMTRPSAKLGLRSARLDVRRLASALFLGLTSFEIPRRLRAFVRAREISLVVLAIAIGVVGGLVAGAMSALVDLLHRVLFALPAGERLSGQAMLNASVALTVPCVGGLVLGLAGHILARTRPIREIDPIEANALHGGRMSVRGSLIVAAQTVWSCGVGASVGLEAGYTQLASGMASFVGRAFRLRRGDLRILVGCGAAGGIAGAFGAPLAGAFYAFELVIGTYSVASLASVAVSSLVGFLVAQQLGVEPLNLFGDAVALSGRDLVFAGLLGFAGAIVGITVMRSVGMCEALFLRSGIPPALRPAVAGVGVGVCALLSPQVMASGHGAIHLAGLVNRPLADVALVFGLKVVASTLSLGGGFRGGLFFASLLLGALGGHLFAGGVGALTGPLLLDPRAYAVIGMGAVSASIIGAPLTMTFVALETTRDPALTAAVLIAVVVSGVATRETFGYSFATWRFHLRGETIRSAADVGWIRDLTVERMMRRDVKTVPDDTGLEEFQTAFPLGSQSRVIVIDREGRYAGIVSVPEAHSPDLSKQDTIKALLHNSGHALLPSMTIKSAVEVFDQAEAEALAVIDSKRSRRVIGILTEAHALRRYAEEFDRRRRDLMGEP